MKNILILVSLVLMGCNKSKLEKDPIPAPTEITSDTVVEVESHNSRNSLDYIGLYSGELPCADCAGIKTTLEVNEGFTFILTKIYEGKNPHKDETKGSYSWNDSGNTIILDNLAGEPNRFLVIENGLVQLDLNGERIEGKLANHYILKKMSENEAAKTDAKPNRKRTQIADKKWILSEINGELLTKQNEVYYINFDAKGSFSAFAGCNRINGQYKSDDSQLAMINILATRMACANLKDETQFLEMLRKTDNFVINSEVLLLRKSKEVLARFESNPK